ncbi:hypothetical protein DVH24_035645 [Malus domestica]|uniref:Uncharacterized protein n=1 Tax=Malus domestica TaxID=3750 RepID=A0A498JPZ4_MALDO|nr:hypothetical protein DVH24_035645 [Malus domestica]
MAMKPLRVGFIPNRPNDTQREAERHDPRPAAREHVRVPRRGTEEEGDNYDEKLKRTARAVECKRKKKMKSIADSFRIESIWILRQRPS